MKRRAFLITEMLITLGVLVVAAGLVAQIATWSIQQKHALEVRQQTTLLASNVLEEARLVPMEDLTPSWGQAQSLSAEMLARWPQSTLTVSITPAGPLKKVSVTLSLKGVDTVNRPVTLTAWFGPEAP